MKKLVIIRHGEFLHRDPRVLDIDCPLTREGRKNISEVVSTLSGQGICPDLVLTSPARRAQETAEIFVKKMALSPDELSVNDSIYEAEQSQLLRLIHALDNSIETVVLIGHNPGVSALLRYLVDPAMSEVSPSSGAVIDLEVNHWRDASFRNVVQKQVISQTKKSHGNGLWRRFIIWRRKKIESVELFIVFLVGLILILGAVAWAIYSVSEPSLKAERRVGVEETTED